MHRRDETGPDPDGPGSQGGFLSARRGNMMIAFVLLIGLILVAGMIIANSPTPVTPQRDMPNPEDDADQIERDMSRALQADLADVDPPAANSTTEEGVPELPPKLERQLSSAIVTHPALANLSDERLHYVRYRVAAVLQQSQGGRGHHDHPAGREQLPPWGGGAVGTDPIRAGARRRWGDRPGRRCAVPGGGDRHRRRGHPESQSHGDPPVAT